MFVALRLLWLGSLTAITSGFTLLVAIGMAASGSPPLVLEDFIYAFRAVSDGATWLIRHRMPDQVRQQASHHAPILSWLLPTLAAVTFGGIFVFANPDLFDTVAVRMRGVIDRIWLWFEGISIWEFPCCVFALLFGAGLLRPAIPSFRIGAVETEPACRVGNEERAPPYAPPYAPLYAAFRNTLLTLIGLFAVYLTFEFVTLWKREFPAGFYYAGYAHQGAAWLTFALALATGTMSWIFSGLILVDSRRSKLERLAWIWSAQNLLLAGAVYNRLMIYVGYNGMTRMRTVGFFGITLVAIGFGLVVYKIAKGRGFWWLCRRRNHTRGCDGPTGRTPRKTSKDKPTDAVALDAIQSDNLNARRRATNTPFKLFPYLESETRREAAIKRFRNYAMKWY